MSNAVKLSEARMGEIALAILTHQLSENLPTQESMRRELPNRAKALDLHEGEAVAFMQQILPKAVGIRLGCESVGLVFRER